MQLVTSDFLRDGDCVIISPKIRVEQRLISAENLVDGTNVVGVSHGSEAVRLSFSLRSIISLPEVDVTAVNSKRSKFDPKDLQKSLLKRIGQVKWTR